MADQINSDVLAAIRRAMLAGRQDDNFSLDHNPDWKYNKMYGHIFNQMEPGDDNYLMFPEQQRQHFFGSGDQYAQNGPFTGQRTAPDVPSARDVILLERSGDPAVRKMFEDTFGTEALDREHRNRYGIRNSDYVATPRPRPPEAPVSAQEDYLGSLPPPMEPYETQGPNYQNAPTQDIRDRARDHLAGYGPSSDLKRDRADGTFFDRAHDTFPKGPATPIDDYRLQALENMMRQGVENTQPTESMEDLMQRPIPPPMSSEGIDDMIRRHLQDLRRQQMEEDPGLAEFERKRTIQP